MDKEELDNKIADLDLDLQDVFNRYLKGELTSVYAKLRITDIGRQISLLQQVLNHETKTHAKAKGISGAE